MEGYTGSLKKTWFLTSCIDSDNLLGFLISAGATQGVITFGLGCIWCHVFNLCCVHHVAAN